VLLAFTRESLSSLVDDRASLDDRPEVANIKTTTLVAIVFSAEFFREPLGDELLDARRRQIQNQRDFFYPENSRLFFFFPFLFHFSSE
jgi:hypothetical protein